MAPLPSALMFALAAMPTVTLPCVDASTQLQVSPMAVGDAGVTVARALVCWGERCRLDGEEIDRPAPLGTSSPTSPRVEAKRVCTGTRCDALGPRLTAARASVETASATVDHALVVVEHDVWNRVTDRRIELRQPKQGPHDAPTSLIAVRVVGDRVLAAWDCEEFCNAQGALFDARGRTSGPSFEVSPAWSPTPGDLVELGPTRFLLLANFGVITLLDQGRRVASFTLGDHPRATPHPVQVQARRLEREGDVALFWCGDYACHLARLEVREGPPFELVHFVDEVMPRCEP